VASESISICKVLSLAKRFVDSASKLLWRLVSALVLKVASLLTAVVLAVTSEWILLCNTPSAASALDSSPETSAIILVISVS